MYDGIEKKILQNMNKKLVMKKVELLSLIRDDVSRPREVLSSVMRMLTQKGLVTPVYAYESTFAITQTGMKEASRL